MTRAVLFSLASLLSLVLGAVDPPATTPAASLAGCCGSKVVDSGTGDARDGIYNLTTTRFDLPVFCGDACVYSKVGSTPEDLYCFGDGDLDSMCYAPVEDNVTPPQVAPGGGGGGVENEIPAGEYYTNNLPGSNTGSLQCNILFSVENEDRQSRLDLAAMGALVTFSPANNIWSARKLRFTRIDGESSGEVKFDHLVAVFATSDIGSILRLDIKAATATSTDVTTSRLMVKNGDSTDCSGPVTYETEYGIFSEDGVYTLDIGEEGTAGQKTPWDQANGNTRFHLNPLT